MSHDDRIANVVVALGARRFHYEGRASDGWLRLRGDLRTATSGNHPCEFRLDPQLIELPRIRLLTVPASLPDVVPHLVGDGQLCYIAKGTIVLDVFDGPGQVLACLAEAERVLDDVLKGNLRDDLEEEFYAYWGNSFCFVDVEGDRPGAEQSLVMDLDHDLLVVVTDDETRTRQKLTALNLTPSELRIPTYRVQTTAKPRPHIRAWPPKTVADILDWQESLDPACRKRIERKLKEGITSPHKVALFLVQSPLMTYAFTVFYDRGERRHGMRWTPRKPLGALAVTSMSVVRIDDAYLASRSTPGRKTLAGKHIALIGCGTIGGYLAEMLVKAGAGTMGGQLTLVDPDSLAPGNIGRHRLGFPSVFKNKATELAAELCRLAPTADLRALPVRVQEAQLGPIDLLLDATGEESLGHWLVLKYTSLPMLTAWVEGPGIAVRALLRASPSGACYRCLWQASRAGLYPAIAGGTPTVHAGQGCEGLYLPFAATVSVQGASLAADMALDWANGIVAPALRTRLTDAAQALATPDCNPARVDSCPACHT